MYSEGDKYFEIMKMKLQLFLVLASPVLLVLFTSESINGGGYVDTDKVIAAEYQKSLEEYSRKLYRDYMQAQKRAFVDDNIEKLLDMESGTLKFKSFKERVERMVEAYLEGDEDFFKKKYYGANVGEEVYHFDWDVAPFEDAQDVVFTSGVKVRMHPVKKGWYRHCGWDLFPFKDCATDVYAHCPMVTKEKKGRNLRMQSLLDSDIEYVYRHLRKGKKWRSIHVGDTVMTGEPFCVIGPKIAGITKCHLHMEWIVDGKVSNPKKMIDNKTYLATAKHFVLRQNKKNPWYYDMIPVYEVPESYRTCVYEEKIDIPDFSTHIIGSCSLFETPDQHNVGRGFNLGKKL